jgi:hypothetical protein
MTLQKKGNSCNRILRFSKNKFTGDIENSPHKNPKKKHTKTKNKTLPPTIDESFLEEQKY